MGFQPGVLRPGTVVAVRGWSKLPEAACLDIMAGRLNATDAAMLAAVAIDINHGRGASYRTAAELGRDVDVPSRSAQRSMYGHQGDDYHQQSLGLLGRYLETDGECLTWRPTVLRRFVRIGPDDREALATRPPWAAVAVWAWSKLRLDGKERREGIPWSAGDMARDLAELTQQAKRWTAGQARRALVGAADRAGALAAKLVRMRDGEILPRYPLDGPPTPADEPQRPPRAAAAPPEQAPDPDPQPAQIRIHRGAPGRSTVAPPAAPIEWWQISRIGKGERVPLIDLLQQQAKQAGWTVDDLADGAAPLADMVAFLESDRSWAPPGRRWSRRAMAYLLPELRNRIRNHDAEQASARASREKERAAYAPILLRAAEQVDDDETAAELEQLAGRDLPKTRDLEVALDLLLYRHWTRAVEAMAADEYRQAVEKAQEHLPANAWMMSPEAVDDWIDSWIGHRLAAERPELSIGQLLPPAVV